MYEYVYAGLGGRLLPHAAILRLRTDLRVRLPARRPYVRLLTWPPADAHGPVLARSPGSTVTLVPTTARLPDDRARACALHTERENRACPTRQSVTSSTIHRQNILLSERNRLLKDEYGTEKP